MLIIGPKYAQTLASGVNKYKIYIATYNLTKKKIGTKITIVKLKKRIFDMTAQTNHPAFPQPKDPNIRIWRYMDFTKYVFMLETSSLYFARADMLGDPFEGSYSKVNIQLRPIVYKDAQLPLRVFDDMVRFTRWVREWTYVNCWHMNEYESAAMWRLYAKSSDAIAIQTAYAKLAACLPNEVFLGAVQYIDYEKDWFLEGNILYPFMYKRRIQKGQTLNCEFIRNAIHNK